MSKISEMTRQSWIESTFPEWGTWLVEDIENEVVAPGNVAMWWLGCTGVWFKTPADTNITIDLWCGNGKRTHGDGKMKVGHQMANMCGGRAMQPNLRNVPFVIDPFAFKKVDAVLATHYHQDHMSPEWAAHVINSGMTTTDENGKEIFHLLAGKDNNKDQSYFLAWLSQFQLSKSMFPIGYLEKSEVREIAKKAWLPNADRKDSQWICFVGKVDLSKFLEKKIEHKPGNIVTTSGKILWQHKWVFYYTVGQRKWLDIWGLKEPVFVVKKDILKNELIVWTTSDEKLYDDSLKVYSMHFLAWEVDFPLNAKAKIRYRQEDQDVIVTKENDHYLVKFLNPQRAIASWQIVALFVNDELVASWVIA